MFDVVTEPATGRIDLVGEFDLACVERFRDACAVIVAHGPAEVVVDLARLRFIDATGIGSIRELANTLAARNTPLRIVNADARTRRVFSLCGLDTMLSGSTGPWRPSSALEG